MNIQKSRKMIVGIGMAIAVVAGIVLFVQHSSHPVAPVADTAGPAAPVAETPAAAAPDAAAPIPAAPAAVAQVPEGAAAVARDENVDTKNAAGTKSPVVEHKLSRDRRMANADTSAVVTDGASSRARSAAETRDVSAPETVASRVIRLETLNEMTTTTNGSSPADEQIAGSNAEPVASDSQITTDVKSEIASDSGSKGSNIGVTTTRGVVVLTGSMPSRDAIDHVKDVAGKVKDVKSVDASALTLASL